MNLASLVTTPSQLEWNMQFQTTLNDSCFVPSHEWCQHLNWIVVADVHCTIHRCRKLGLAIWIRRVFASMCSKRDAVESQRERPSCGNGEHYHVAIRYRRYSDRRRLILAVRNVDGLICESVLTQNRRKTRDVNSPITIIPIVVGSLKNR